MVQIDVMRHAKTQWNLEKRLQGLTDIPLCAKGEQDALVWARRLADKPYDLILSSPLIRAEQTARIISEKAATDIEIVDGLREQDFGRWEGKTIKELREQFPGWVESQEARGWAFCPPLGEARTAVLDRALSALARACRKNRGRRLLVVTHSSVMKILIYHILGKTFLPGREKKEMREDEPVLKAWHLHRLNWEKQLKIEALNSIALL
jgi:probable phosphoglycerate mutase